MYSNTVAVEPDLNGVGKGFQYNRLPTVFAGHRIVVGFVGHGRISTNGWICLLGNINSIFGHRTKCLTVFFQHNPNILRTAVHLVVEVFDALCQKLSVQLLQRIHSRKWHADIPSNIANKILN